MIKTICYQRSPVRLFLSSDYKQDCKPVPILTSVLHFLFFLCQNNSNYRYGNVLFITKASLSFQKVSRLFGSVCIHFILSDTALYWLFSVKANYLTVILVFVHVF